MKSQFDIDPCFLVTSIDLLITPFYTMPTRMNTYAATRNAIVLSNGTYSFKIPGNGQYVDVYVRIVDPQDEYTRLHATPYVVQQIGTANFNEIVIWKSPRGSLFAVLGPGAAQNRSYEDITGAMEKTSTPESKWEPLQIAAWAQNSQASSSTANVTGSSARGPMRTAFPQQYASSAVWSATEASQPTGQQTAPRNSRSPGEVAAPATFVGGVRRGGRGGSSVRGRGSNKKKVDFSPYVSLYQANRIIGSTQKPS